ncbi:MAG TPA: hypothetical protein VMT85_12650 [Thermoanaerobaculia bacterium]|nr:hypothetical protein [Thermoanaerobaculia bacterium]
MIAVSTEGAARVHATIPGDNNGHLVHHDGALWVVGRSAHQIFRVTMDGEVSVFAGSGEKGGADGEPRKASFCYPNDLGWSPDGTVLYVNDVANHESEGRILGPTRIRRIFVQE